LDDARPDQLHVGLRKERKLALFSAPIRFIDFRQDGGAALCLLDRLLGTKQFAPATGHKLNLNMHPQV
jgi:hypothetical protein